MGKRWTDKEDNTLAALRDSGMPNSEIASSMGRSTQAIYQRAYVLRRNEPTFREVVDTAFAKHRIEFGGVVDTARFHEVVDTAFAKYTIEFGEPDEVDVLYEQCKERLYPNSKYITTSSKLLNDEVGQRLADIATSVQKNKPKPQWWKAMMWWRK
jgi:hypothetical protein